VSRSYLPAHGDIVWISMSPQAGRKQAWRRPALVVSPKEYNVRVGLALMCPITSQVKGYPFEVALPPGLPVQGVILSDQMRSLDWRTRKAEFVGRLRRAEVVEALQKLSVLLSPEDV